MPLSPEQALMLGEIKGLVSEMRATQSQHSERFERLDARLRDQEKAAAVGGAWAGGVVTIGLALAIEGAKVWLRNKSGGT